MNHSTERKETAGGMNHSTKRKGTNLSTKRKGTTGFDALDCALELVRVLRPVFDRLERVDRKLLDQARRAVQSVALNLAEGRGRAGRDRTQHWRIAFGSAEELEVALRVADAFGYLGALELGQADRLLDKLHAMLWRMTRG